MKFIRLENLLAVVLASLLVTCLAGLFLTRDAGSKPDAKQPTERPLPDESLYDTARQMASLADTAEEQNLAREAVRLTDHEIDQAVASALRDVTAQSAAASGPVKELAERIVRLKAQIASEQQRIAKLAKESASDSKAGDQLELAKAQLALEDDELEDAQQDLDRQGGDRRSKLERARQRHESMAKVTDLPKLTAAASDTTLSQQIRLWFSLGDRADRLEAARQQATSKVTRLARVHDTLEKLVNNQAVPDEALAAMVGRLRHLSDQRKTLVELDKRIRDCQQLGDVYKSWMAAVETRRHGVLHLLFGSLATVLAILLAVVGVEKAIRRTFRNLTDSKRLHQLRVMITIALQVIGVLVILLILFGVPTQTSTIIGLATAGLTIALKDFVVAFVGWFVLMGRNGIRVGDWVEIGGVGGEVVEIGLLRTVLLETTGHPTGRRVAFMNGFAIEGHYFNFSTSGQWLWDELVVSLPSGVDPYQAAHDIRQAVERETAADAEAAEQDWTRATHQYGTRPFSAKPSAEVRPSAVGPDAVVRYITRAPQRGEVRSRLLRVIVELLQRASGT